MPTKAKGHCFPKNQGLLVIGLET